MLTADKLTDTDLAAALFASWLPAGSLLTPDAVDAAIALGLRTHGGAAGCVAELAAAYGENPSSAAGRMRWALCTLHRSSCGSRP